MYHKMMFHASLVNRIMLFVELILYVRSGVKKGNNLPAIRQNGLSTKKDFVAAFELPRGIQIV